MMRHAVNKADIKTSYIGYQVNPVYPVTNQPDKQTYRTGDRPDIR